MLVLSRRIGEKVVLPDFGITVQVVDVSRRGVVRLGFDAPLDVAIYREELLDRDKLLPTDHDARSAYVAHSS
jgi:carbon storage regulator CsrA